MQSDRELEEMIDAAIPGYSQVEPPPGLEQRIVTRSRSEKLSHSRSAWQWSIAIPAMACLLILFLMIGKRIPYPQTFKNTATSTLDAPPRAVVGVATLPIRHSTLPHPRTWVTNATRSPQPLPKQDVFPSPTAPTAEEQALIALTRAQARIVPQSANLDADVEITAVHIAELEIKPIPPVDELQLGPAADLSMPANQQP